jgi:glycosyltransferase involved in cell wall biosynthesis
MSCKYSIIIPHYSGDDYLPTCIESVLTQNYTDFELIVSDDKSAPKTKEYLLNLNHPNVTIVNPPTGLSMTEHWEWALGHAKGEWQMFLGQDDGLQGYFFQLADLLTNYASKINLKVIMSDRAYFFWRGSETMFNNIAVNYSASNRIGIKNTKIESLKALLGFQSYFELPQMYTTSLFHKCLLLEAKLMQGGSIFKTHPQDANLAAIACSLETKYLQSRIPLGWVGTSPKSAGMAVTTEIDNKLNDKRDVNELKTDYLGKIYNSSLNYNDYLVGDFKLGNLNLYLWQSFLQTKELRSEAYNKFITSKFFRIIFFSSIINDLKYNNTNIFNLEKLKILVKHNNVNFSIIYLISIFMFFLKKVYFLYKNLVEAKNSFFYSRIKYKAFWQNKSKILLNSEGLKVNDLIMQKEFLKNIKF